MTTVPAAAAFGAYSADTDAAGREQRDLASLEIEILERLDRNRFAAERTVRPTERSLASG